MEPPVSSWVSINNNQNNMMNLLLNRLIDLEVRVKSLEEENKKLKAQIDNRNVSFGKCITIGASGKANSNGFIMVISGFNKIASITIDGNKVQFVDRRDKYGQGRVSCCSPISLGSSCVCKGEKFYFFPLLTK